MKKELLEDKVVKFDGKTYPDSGWCVIFAGGPGSGKGTAYKYLISISGKKFDPDDLSSYIDSKFHMKDGNLVIKKKQDITKANDEITVRGNKYSRGNFEPSGMNMKNPDYTEYMYQIRKDSGLRDSKWNSMFNSDDNKLTNIIFDITGSSQGKINRIIYRAKELGYKISLIYILNDIENQIKNNKSRDRSVPDSAVKEITLDVYNTLMDMVYEFGYNTNGTLGMVDECWAIVQTKGDGKAYDIRNNRDDKSSYIKDANVFKLKDNINDNFNFDIGDVKNFVTNQLSKIDKSGNSLSEEYYMYHMYSD